jgi:hypothetical protein
MVHTLKRVYLYTAVTFALLFTAGFAINLLITLFHAAGMLPGYYNGSEFVTDTYYSPTRQQIETSIVYFVVVTVVGGLLFGGSHYWLIRRDARGDPQADAGPTRHAFLNVLLALSVLIAVPAGLTALGEVDQPNFSSDIASPLSFALVFGAVFLLVALERARVRLAGRAAGIIRQIHENALQMILLFIASAFLYGAITTLMRWLLVTGNLARGSCIDQPASETVIGSCPPSVLGPVLQAVFALAAWGLYLWLGRRTWGSAVQRVVWFIAFAYGVAWLLLGVQQLVDTIVGTLLGVGNAWQNALDNGLPFIGVIVTGALIATLYLRWVLRLYSWSLANRRPAAQQGVLAIAAAISLLFFLIGAVAVLDGLLEQVIPNGSRLDPSGWAAATSILVAGLGYLPLWLGYPPRWFGLRRASDPAQAGPVIPRRAYVLSVLIYTAIPAVIALVVLLYQLVAIPQNLDQASPTAERYSAVAFLVLGVTALYHLLRLRADLRLSRSRAAVETAKGSAGATLAAGAPGPLAGAEVVASEATAPFSMPASGDQETLVSAAGDGQATLEGILQEVASGSLDTTTAAARIRSLLAL